MKDKYVTSLLLFFVFVLEREKKSTIYAILYERISISLNTTSSIKLLKKYRERKKRRNKSDLS